MGFGLSVEKTLLELQIQLKLTKAHIPAHKVAVELEDLYETVKWPLNKTHSKVGPFHPKTQSLNSSHFV